MASCALPSAITIDRIWTQNHSSFNWNEKQFCNAFKDVKSLVEEEENKILDFSRLETDIIRNVLGEESDHCDPNQCENIVENFPSFNYVPIPIPHTFTKLNPILKLCSIESMRSSISMHDQQLRDVQEMVRKNLSKTQHFPTAQQHNKASSTDKANELLKQLTLPKMVPPTSNFSYNPSLNHFLECAQLPKIDAAAANKSTPMPSNAAALQCHQLFENRSISAVSTGRGGQNEPLLPATSSFLPQSHLRHNETQPYLPRTKTQAMASNLTNQPFLQSVNCTTQGSFLKQNLSSNHNAINFSRTGPSARQGYRFNVNQQHNDCEAQRVNNMKRRLAPRLAAKYSHKYKSQYQVKAELKTFAQIVAETRPEETTGH
uniref:Uncharacterized protein n=1 Tax=Ciona savignyi TaxID=51511 RepID=H2Z3S6_CIOSA